jgi:hypothetical protein
LSEFRAVFNYLELHVISRENAASLIDSACLIKFEVAFY